MQGLLTLKPPSWCFCYVAIDKCKWYHVATFFNHVESFSLGLKFWSRNGTAASCLCNLLHYIILLCHILHCPLHAGMPRRRSPCQHFHLPRCLTSFPRLAFIYHLTLPSLLPASASLNPQASACLRCVLSHPITHPLPPYRRCQRSTPTQTSWQALLESIKEAMNTAPLLFRPQIQLRVWVCSLALFTYCRWQQIDVVSERLPVDTTPHRIIPIYDSTKFHQTQNPYVV